MPTSRRTREFPFLRGLDRMRLRFGKLRATAASGTRVTHALGPGVDFREFRRYAPGDDLRFLDWNAYGRLDQLYIKQFEAFGELTLNLVVDRTPSMDFGGQGPGTPGHKLTFARNLAAALGYVALNSLDRVRLLTLPWLARQQALTLQGRNRIPVWLDVMSQLGPHPIRQHTRSLRDLLSDQRHRHLVVIISDFQETSTWFSFIEFLRRHVASVFAIHLVSPEERHPPIFPGEVDMTDVEWSGGGAARLEITADAIRAYHEEFELHLRRVRAFCQQKRMGHLELDTATPLGTDLWHRFRREGIWD